MTARPNGDRSRALRSRGTSVGANGRRGSSSQPCENLLRVFTASAAAPRRRPSILLSSLLVCGGRSVFGTRRRFFLSVGGWARDIFSRAGRKICRREILLARLNSYNVAHPVRCGEVRGALAWLDGDAGKVPWLADFAGVWKSSLTV